MLKSSAIFSLVLLLSFSATAQDSRASEQAKQFQGKAEYYSKKIFKKGTAEVGIKPDDSPELKAAYEAALKKASEKSYTLTFNKKEALYEKQEVLEPPKPKTDGVQVLLKFSGEGRKYINIQDKTKIVEDDILGREYLIEEQLQSLEWKLIDESKKIGDYNCFKAELIIPVTDKEKQDYEEFLKKSETQVSLFPMKEPSEKKITAWYTPEIPVSLGPESYWGLPGLILELNDGQMVVLCSKVVLSNKEVSKIKVPEVGKKVSQEEFELIHKEKMDEIYSR